MNLDEKIRILNLTVQKKKGHSNMGLTSTSHRRDYGRKVGRAGVGRDGDTASGTKDLTMLDPKVGLKT